MPTTKARALQVIYETNRGRDCNIKGRKGEKSHVGCDKQRHPKGEILSSDWGETSGGMTLPTKKITYCQVFQPTQQLVDQNLGYILTSVILPNCEEWKDVLKKNKQYTNHLVVVVVVRWW